MRLLQFVEKSSVLRPPYHRIKCWIGAFLDKSEDKLVNLSASCGLEKHGVTDMVSLLMQGSDIMKVLGQRVRDNLPVVNCSEVRILPPITSPEKVLCVGMNYVDHCAEQNQPVPSKPVIFNKFSLSIIGPEDQLTYPNVTTQLDWETELAFVIGKKIVAGSNPDAETISSAIFGYCVTQDISARDWQMSRKRNMGQWTMGKALDGFCPIGASIVTADEFPSDFATKAAALHIGCAVNNVPKQSSKLSQLVFKPADIVSYCAKFWTLLPGDLILTGTPPGVGIFRKPPEFINRGDSITTTIENIGTFTTKVV